MRGLNRKTDWQRQLSQWVCNRTNALLFCLGPLCFQPGSSQEKPRESKRKRAARKKGGGGGGCTPNPKRHFHGCPLLVKHTPNSRPPFSHSHTIWILIQSCLLPRASTPISCFLNRKPLVQRILFSADLLAGPGNQADKWRCAVSQQTLGDSTLTNRCPSLMQSFWLKNGDLWAMWLTETKAKGPRQEHGPRVRTCSALVNKTLSEVISFKSASPLGVK